jgi:serine/threonine protein kinase
MNPKPASEPDVPPVDSQWLVHCSPERTLVARRRGEDIELVKIFEQGSLLDAQQEAEIAKNLAHPGVVPYRTAGQDPVTNKPCVTMDYCEGENLERLVADAGPLPAGRAASMIAQLASVFADIHAIPRPGAPHGVVHRDVKPANIQSTRDEEGKARIILMDLEHVVPRRAPGGEHEAPTSPGFTGGTHGYSPAESYLGAHPHPGFDVFGIGATMFFLLTGCQAFPQREVAETIALVRDGSSRLQLLRGQPDTLRLLIEECLASDETRRPTAADIDARLCEFLDALSDSDALQDRALQAIQSAEFEDAAKFLDEASADPSHDKNRVLDLERLSEQRSRLLHRIGGPPELSAPEQDGDDDLETVARHVATNLPRLTAFLTRFPHHRATADTRRGLAQTGHDLLERVPPCVASLKMNANFDRARGLIEATALAAKAIHRVPGGLSLPTADPGHLPGPLLRNPGQLLERTLRDVERTEKTHLEIVARLEDAETRLDLAGAAVVVDEITSIYGGASTVAAPLKDRLMRLEFYMQRIAWPQQLLVQLKELLDLSELPHDLERVSAFCKLCGDHVAEAKAIRGKGGARSLLDIIHQMLEDFPRVRPAVAEAEAALADAMKSITLYAWDCLNEATQKLDAVPIPIRPVQKMLNRLDGIRMLESFLDLPDQSRERLQDEIERVRMRLDQARTTRDNIARGAEEAMERGHLTTALFDMARAVDKFEDEPTEDAAGGGQLTDRLEEAKQTKKELERSIVENQRLAALYAELLEDEKSSMGDRLKALGERATALNQLIGTLGPEKGSHYALDLREVIVDLVQEKADQGERRIDRATDPAVRLKIAQATLRDLRETTSSSAMAGKRFEGIGIPPEAGSGIQRLLDHWQFKEHEIHNQVSREGQAVVDEQKRRRRTTVMRLVAGVVVLVSLFTTWRVVEAWGKEAPNVQFTPPTSRVEKSSSGIDYPKKLPAYLALSSFVERLNFNKVDDHNVIRDLELASQSARLVAHLGQLIDGDLVPEPAWAQDLKGMLSKLDRSLTDLDQRIGEDSSWRTFFNAMEKFGRSAHLVGLSLVLVKRTDLAFLDDLTQDLESLPHIAIDPADLAHLRKLASGK